MTDRSWWPEGYDLPAFRVKRQTYGLMEGGDWVRGSSVTTLAHTALRYPTTTPEDYDPALKRWSLHTLPFVPERFELKLRDQDGTRKQFEVIKRLFRAAAAFFRGESFADVARKAG